MIYESRSIRVKMIREPGLHTNEETSVKPIFRSYKLGETILSFVVAVYFFQCFKDKIPGDFFPQASRKKKKKRERNTESPPFSTLVWWFKMPKGYAGLHANVSLSLLFLPNFIYRNAVCKLSQYHL